MPIKINVTNSRKADFQFHQHDIIRVENIKTQRSTGTKLEHVSLQCRFTG